MSVSIFPTALFSLATVLALTVSVAAQDDGQMVQIGDDELFHVTVGSGVPIVALHGGLGLDHAYLRPALDAWAEFAEIHYIDLAGNGRSSAPADYSEITIATMADDVAEFADAIGLDQFVLFGHSYGGFIAQEFALRHGDRLSGLILSNTSGRLGYDIVFPDWAPVEAQAAVGQIFSEPMESDEHWAETWKTALPAYWRDPDPDLFTSIHEATEYRAAAITNALGLLAEFNTLEGLADVEVPTLIMSGRDDFVTGVQAHEDLHAALPASELHIFEESGHYPFFTEAPAYNAIVKEWLERL